ncbi:MAG: malate synthase G, partial [Pseudomonadota bacterium]
MTMMTSRAGLSVDERLASFLESEVLVPLGRDVDAFWTGFAALVNAFTPRNRDLLAKREELQAQIDAWHVERKGKPQDAAQYRAFLTEIGYLAPEPGDFTIGTQNVDAEIATMAGPQLVVPILNARFLLNAANARWGSLYDAFYGTDALDAPPAKPGGYDKARGDAVIARGREFLDQALPLVDQSWADLADENDGKLIDEGQYVGKTEKGLLFKNNGLHIEVVFDRSTPVGADDKAGIADINVEAALSTIADCEDSVAAVDAEDKLLAYTNWLGIIRGDLTESFDKGGRTLTRKLNGDKAYTDRDGNAQTLPGRSMMFVRNVGHLMTNPAILLEDGGEIPEGIMDAVFTSAISTIDVEGKAIYGNSKHASIYIVKPKMHGPEECAFTNDLFNAVEDLIGLPRHTVKVG